MAGALPDGWAEHLDPGSGRSFFCNAASGETVWERPQPAAAAAGALPNGWVEHLDQGSGRTFYHKEATGETAWERPQAEAAAAAPAALAAPGALPEGWSEHLDPGSGRSFFSHAATGETAWERPQAPAAAPEVNHPAPSSLPEGWAEHSDPGSGRVFYCKAATGETSWEKPTAPTGTWSTSQANDLGRNPQPPLHILQQRTEVLSTQQGGSWTSVARVIDALNDGVLVVSGGLCVIFSASKESFWLLWRSDKEKEAENVISATG